MKQDRFPDLPLGPAAFDPASGAAAAAHLAVAATACCPHRPARPPRQCGPLPFLIQRDGTWTFDGETVRIVAGGKAHPVRLALGELAVPVEALAGISFEQARKGGRLRLRLRGAFVNLQPVPMAVALGGFLLILDALGPEGVAPFIYFQF